ncbi:WPP domain-associated protein-like isoform X2 [Macadamia integrifolia]|uniref:WPP domain-associated protein-like isoform X2 n=1 Tax=Macadamia integrifolia TaxID=60698 RepID=UPI001C527F16|nr:WPP domain-associated protein-like isoform X2 [Macadamia integrifolia]
MEGSKVLDGSGVWSAGVTSPSDGLMQPSISFKESENLRSDLLEDLDSYLEDIDDRLTISRIVNDSVIKGMVNAVTEESAEKIAMKELEVQRLSERLQLYESGADRVKELTFPAVGIDNDGMKFMLQSSFLGTDVEQGKSEDYFSDLRRYTEEQFQRLQKDINDLKGSNMAGRMKSAVGSQGLGNHIQRKVYDKWEEVDETINMLRNTVNTVFYRVDDIAYLSKTSHSEWQQDQEFQEEIEAIVIQNSIKSLQEELNIHVCSSENISQLMNEISSLREELGFISRSLSSFELGYLPCHGSHESGEECNATRNDSVNQNVCNHISLPASLQMENDKLEPKSSVLDRMDSAQLKCMSSDELISLFKAEMVNMKRNHESMLQQKTEAYFSLWRELLKRGPLSVRKDKEFDSLKKKIPEVIVKLDDILNKKKEFTVSYEDSMNIHILKDRVNAMLSENHQLKELLANKREEVKSLSSQVPGATDKISHRSLTGADLFEEARKWDVEDSDLKFRVMQDIYGTIFREAVKDAEATVDWGITNSDMEYIIMQDICRIIYKDAVKDTQAVVNIIKAEYENENKRRVSLETMLLETRKALRLGTEEKEQLKQEKLSLSKLLAEKEKLALEIESALMKEKECSELVCQEFNLLKDCVNQQERLISESFTELDLSKSRFEEALEFIGQYEGGIMKLDQKLKLAMEELCVADEERRALHGAIQAKEGTITLAEFKEREHRKEMESIILSIEGLSKAFVDFESQLTKNVAQNTLRLEKLTSQCYPLVKKATVLGRKYSDLQKAEEEVDLLGDEVDALLNLLEKIYIALDHYSPILQHYPGIMEILKLVGRELNGEMVKPF